MEPLRTGGGWSTLGTMTGGAGCSISGSTGAGTGTGSGVCVCVCVCDFPGYFACGLYLFLFCYNTIIDCTLQTTEVFTRRRPSDTSHGWPDVC